MMRPPEGTRYRVLRDFNSTDLKPCAPYAWTNDPYTFRVGDVITFAGTATGWGSDPALDTVLVGADGQKHRVMSGWGVTHHLDPESGYTEVVT